MKKEKEGYVGMELERTELEYRLYLKLVGVGVG
jgi:hypothetical protein